MSYELAFRPVQNEPGEVQKLSKMAALTFADTFRHYETDDLQSYLDSALSPEALTRELETPENQFFFVLVDGAKAGYLKWIHPTEKYLEHLDVTWKSPFLLERFYFLSSYCGKGLGAVALAFVESYARYQAGADVLYLSVWDHNFRAQSFYQKHGFRTIGSFHYPVGCELDHELLFFKRLA